MSPPDGTPSKPVPIPIVKGTYYEMLNLYLKRDKIDKYVTEEVIIPNYHTTEKTAYILEATVCHGSFCCDFDSNITVLPGPFAGVSKIN